MADPVTPPPRRGIPLQGKFGVAYFFLAVVVGLGVGLLVVFLGRPEHSDAVTRPAWLTLHGTAAAQQVGEYVGQRYRLEDGTQLVAVTAELPQLFPQADQSIRIGKIAVRPGYPDDSRKDISVFDTDKTIAYILCGLGAADQRCALPGKASVVRGLLLRREALDLALYTFKYVPDFDSVVAFIPAPAGTKSQQVPQRMVYFRRSELEPRLNPLLGQTLSLGPVLTPDAINPRDLAIAQQLTIPDLGSERFSGFYGYRFQQSPDGTFFLELAPIGA